MGLKLGDQNELTIRRIKRGKTYSFVRANGTRIKHAGTIKRLNAMAMPPAYVEVRYSPDPASHLQAVGVDAAGRAHFVISDVPVSFGKLARYYRDKLKAPDALYLDGNVSGLWDPAMGRLDSGPPLGPLIVVEKRAKAEP